MKSSPVNRLCDFSTDLAELVQRCCAGVVAVRPGAARSISGIVWRQGCVVTAAEALAEEPGSLRITSATATDREAKILGRDPTTDIALLAAEGLPDTPLPCADTDSLRPGELALTLGRSPEHGPIAAFASVAVAGVPWRSQLGGRIDRFLRVNAPLARAAEGGAVLDMRGRLVGMAVFGPRRTLLVIPAATIGRVAEQLLANGRVNRGYLGIAMQPVRLPETLQKVANAEVGLLVSGVDPHSGAARGGVLLGDVIVSWNGEPVRDYRQVQGSLGPESVGSAVVLGALRGGALIDLQLSVGERPAAE
ncbi:MAG TPA: trypsin-like peptidase domain-containing protein [Steroidobacteraceae bacterium]|nr:trypsin-like peptidase domain-containing protein [Steroidobacteraceae bacterium]